MWVITAVTNLVCLDKCDLRLPQQRSRYISEKQVNVFAVLPEICCADVDEERQIEGAVDAETSLFLVGTAVTGAILIGCKLKACLQHPNSLNGFRQVLIAWPCSMAIHILSVVFSILSFRLCYTGSYSSHQVYAEPRPCPSLPRGSTSDLPPLLSTRKLPRLKLIKLFEIKPCRSNTSMECLCAWVIHWISRVICISLQRDCYTSEGRERHRAIPVVRTEVQLRFDKSYT